MESDSACLMQNLLILAESGSISNIYWLQNPQKLMYLQKLLLMECKETGKPLRKHQTSRLLVYQGKALIIPDANLKILRP